MLKNSAPKKMQLRNVMLSTYLYNIYIILSLGLCLIERPSLLIMFDFMKLKFLYVSYPILRVKLIILNEIMTNM